MITAEHLVGRTRKAFRFKSQALAAATVIALAGVTTIALAQKSGPELVAPQMITWEDTAVHIRTEPRSDFDFVCPPTEDPGRYPVWGTDIYTDSSSICAAAVHAGAITAAGGPVRILRLDGLDGRNAYIATTRNGITTLPEDDWFWSFMFVEVAE